MRDRNTLFQRSVSIKIIFCIKTVGYISPYFAQFHTFSIDFVTYQVGFIVIFGNFALRIVKIEPDMVTPVFDSVAPAEFQFPTIGFQIGCILFGSTGSDYPRQIHAGSKHVFCVASIPVKSTTQTIIEKSEINAEIQSVYLFPRERTADHERGFQSGNLFSIHQPVTQVRSHVRDIWIIDGVAIAI